jgi:hypothetical protein
MKKIIYFIALISILSSCSEESVNQEKIAQLNSTTEANVQKLMFNQFTKDEKLTFWVQRIELMIEDDSLNQDQKNILNELLTKLNSTIFDVNLPDNEEREVFINVYLVDYINRVKNLFNDQYIDDNFYSARSIRFLGEADVADKDCACKTGSYFTCGFLSNYSCEKSRCRILSDGCGFLMISECNGICK